jgi:hypothetical protein
VVSDAREILDTAASDSDDLVFLKVVAFPADISGDLVAVG